MNKLATYLLALLAIGVVACSDDEPAGNVPLDACYDFVTLEQTGPDGTVFTLQKSEDSPLITYTSPTSLSPDSLINPNLRLIIAYNRQNGAAPYTSGEIDFYGYRFLDNTMQKLAVDSLEEHVSQPVKVQTIARTGPYINMQLQLSCYTAQDPKMLILAVAVNTLERPEPTLRLLYEAADPGQNYQTGYASFDIDALMKKGRYESANIEWLDENGLVKSYKINI